MGAHLNGYNSDMPRTIVLGEPSDKFREIYNIVLKAHLEASARMKAGMTGVECDKIARDVIEQAGYGDQFTHSLGHGIGLATHELPTLSKRAPETPLPSPTVFSVEPGVYLDGETGVRIEDLVSIDHAAGRLERLTHFPSDIVIVGVGR